MVCKDDLKITGGTYTIKASSKAIEANDSIRIAGGVFTRTAGTDALHAENNDDDTLGYIYITGGTFNILAGDDGVLLFDRSSGSEGPALLYEPLSGAAAHVLRCLRYEYVRPHPGVLRPRGKDYRLIHRLQQENPDKEFFSLEPKPLCPNMKKITLENIYFSLKDLSPAVELPQEVIDGARPPIEKMLKAIP